MAKNIAEAVVSDARSGGQDLGQSLKLAQEALLGLASANGYKALVRKFGDLLHQQFNVKVVTLATRSVRLKKLTLKRRAVRFSAELLPHDDATLNSLALALAEADVPVSELKEGYTDFTFQGRALSLAVIEDPESPLGSLLIWDMPQEDLADPSVRTSALLFLDLTIRQLQNECRWYRRLDMTQAMLYKDDLTGLFNYRYFEIALDQELARASRFQAQFCLLFIDMDGFKSVNDQHGHPAGSSVLKQTADVIRDAVREIDVPIRYGGDEFVVVLLGATCAKGLLAAERVRRRIENKEFAVEGGAALRLTCSIGVAAYPEHAKERETLLKLADETMYNSKRGGKNRVTVVGQGGTLSSPKSLTN